MAKVIRYCVKDEHHDGDNNFLIHRPYILANPFTNIKSKKTKAKFIVDTKEDAINLYEEYFDKMIKISEPFKKEWEKLYEAYKKYDVIYIGCYCSEKDNCHGDIIIDKLKRRSIKYLLGRNHSESQEA